MAIQTYRTIQVEQSGIVAAILLNQPPLNILDMAMIEELCAALDALEQDADVRILTFRGAGERAFCAGVSIPDHTPERIVRMIPRFHTIFRLLARTEKITIAALHGHCLGGGLELASMCDLVIASENARLGQPEIKLGQLPPVGIILLPYLAGYRGAANLLFTGAAITAREAQAMGLVNRVVPDGQLLSGLDTLIAELSAQSGTALRMTKQLLRRVQGLDFERLLDLSEEFFLNQVVKTEDAKEGVLAFLEKRAPHWSHQ